MAANSKRQTEIELSERQVKVSGLYRHGYSQKEIAKELKISQPTVSRDLSTTTKYFKDSAVENLGAWKAELLTRNEDLEREYWCLYRRSQRDSQFVEIENYRRPATDGKKNVKSDTRRLVHKERSHGDIACLRGVQGCHDYKAKLLGLVTTKVDIDWRTEAKKRGLDPETFLGDAVALAVAHLEQVNGGVDE